MSIYTIDFTSQMNQVFIAVYFLIAILASLKLRALSGFMFTIGGILMALNEVNVVLSMIFMAIGVIIVSQEGTE
jgi:hypothetical protein